MRHAILYAWMLLPSCATAVLSCAQEQRLMLGAQTAPIDLVGDDRAELGAISAEIWQEVRPTAFVCSFAERACQSPREGDKEHPWRVALSDTAEKKLLALSDKLWARAAFDSRSKIECVTEPVARCALYGGILRRASEVPAGATVISRGG